MLPRAGVNFRPLTRPLFAVFLTVAKLTIIAFRTLAAGHGLTGIGGVVTARRFPGAGITAAAAIAVNTAFAAGAIEIILTLRIVSASLLSLTAGNTVITDRITQTRIANPQALS